MKVLVAVKRVVDYHVKIRVHPDGRGVDTADLKMSMNPFDEIAVEAAVRLQEQGTATATRAVSVGVMESQQTLRMALAMGMDESVLYHTDESLEPLAVAKVLQHQVASWQPDLVLLGKQSIDGDNNQTGQMLAGLLGWPQATFISTLHCEGKRLSIEREVDGGIHRLSCSCPAVLTTDLRLNEPRYASMPNIMKSKSKPLEVLTLDDLKLEIQSKLSVLKVTQPQDHHKHMVLDDVDSLVEKLHLDAKVL